MFLLYLNCLQIFLHGNNLSTLHEHLPTDILPAELGGTGPAFNPGLWAEPVIHSAMKEAEIAANLAQKERESRAKDLVALMQSQNGERKRDGGRIKSGGTELREITTSPRIEKPKIFNGDQIISNEASTPVLDNDSSRLLDSTNGDRFMQVEIDEEIKNEEGCVQQLSSVDIEVKKYREMDVNERSEPDGLPDDIENLEIPSETNSNEFEMIPSRPSSESSKESSFDVDIQVEKIVVRDGAKSATLSEEVSLVT